MRGRATATDAMMAAATSQTFVTSNTVHLGDSVHLRDSVRVRDSVHLRDGLGMMAPGHNGVGDGDGRDDGRGHQQLRPMGEHRERPAHTHTQHTQHTVPHTHTRTLNTLDTLDNTHTHTPHTQHTELGKDLAMIGRATATDAMMAAATNPLFILLPICRSRPCNPDFCINLNSFHSKSSV